MSLSLSVILILGFIIMYVFLVQIYSIFFRITGLTKEKAQFQTISMLTNSGFTTNESEIVVANRLRRTISSCCMITGNVFSVIIVSLVINVLMRFNQEQVEESFTTMTIAFIVFIILFLVSRISFFKKIISRIIENIALTIIKKKSNQNIITLLDNYGINAIVEIYLNNIPTLLKDKSLEESNIKNMYNINILMAKRKNRILEVSKDTIFQQNDILVIFGSYQNIKDVFEHPDKDLEEILDHSISDDNCVDLIDNYGKEAISEIRINRVPDFMKEKKIAECGLKEKYGINILMIKRNDEVFMVTPDTVIIEHDLITVFGTYQNIKKAFINYLNE